jgi:hypothetical protein
VRHLTPLTVATLLLATGCAAGTSDKTVAISLDEDETRVARAAVAVASVLREAGVEVPAEGAADHGTCPGEPGRGVDHTVAFSVTDGPTGGAGHVRESLVDAGWRPRPGDGREVRLSRGEVRLDLTTSRAEPGAVAVEVTGECIEADPEQVREPAGREAVGLG